MHKPQSHMLIWVCGTVRRLIWHYAFEMLPYYTKKCKGCTHVQRLWISHSIIFRMIPFFSWKDNYSCKLVNKSRSEATPVRSSSCKENLPCRTRRPYRWLILNFPQKIDADSLPDWRLENWLHTFIGLGDSCEFGQFLWCSKGISCR